MKVYTIFLIALLSANTHLKAQIIKSDLPVIEGNHNYKFTRTILSEDEENYSDDIMFYDGLGRDLERTKNKNYSGHYLHYLQEYDSLGRKSKSWLPVASGKQYIEPVDVPQIPLSMPKEYFQR